MGSKRPLAELQDRHGGKKRKVFERSQQAEVEEIHSARQLQVLLIFSQENPNEFRHSRRLLDVHNFCMFSWLMLPRYPRLQTASRYFAL
jgi:hypothetical protein